MHAGPEIGVAATINLALGVPDVRQIAVRVWRVRKPKMTGAVLALGLKAKGPAKLRSGHEGWMPVRIVHQAVWRHLMGRLSHTNALLTSSGETSRLKVILSTGLMTPTGVVTQGSHDASRTDYVYETDKAGDGTVEEARVLDDVEATSPIIERFHGVPHGRLMIDPQSLSYFTRELSNQPMMSKLGRVSVRAGPEP